MDNLFKIADAGRTGMIDAADRARFMAGVYLWMMVGLAVSGMTGWSVASSPALSQAVFGNPVMFWGVIIGQVVMVIALSALMNRLSPMVATAMFLLYAALMGVTFASIFMMYTLGSISTVFGVTALTFGALGIFGYVTKIDLAPLGTFLFVALIGLLIAMVVNIFLQNSAFNTVISMVAVLIFSALTAYDVQRIKNTYVGGGFEVEHRQAVFGALQLYLDFINLFIHLLRLMGERR